MQAGPTPEPDWRPPHAYVPGLTPRHPEDLFDPLKAGVGGIAPDQLHQSSLWRFAFDFLDEGYFWEAHELLEAIWLACPPNSAQKLVVQAVIQFANASLKARMGRNNAVARLMVEADRLWAEGFVRADGKVFDFSKSDKPW